MQPARPGEALVGFVVNPRSGQDIRRLVARASVFPNTEKVMMLQRVLTALGAVGVDRVVVGDGQGWDRRQPGRRRRGPPARASTAPGRSWSSWSCRSPAAPADSVTATEALVGLGARLLVVLGGDGTDRVVASACGDVPLLALSTGTNNAFAPIEEATVAGLAAGLVATGRLAVAEACRRAKVLVVEHGARRELALVDVAVTTSSAVGARAVWHPS